VDYLTTTSFIVSGRNPAARTVPDNPRRIEELWSLYKRIRGEKRLREVIDSRYGQALLTAYLKDANYVDTARLLEEIGAYERKHLEPRGIHLSLAGDVATSQAMIDGIVTTQIRCLLIALAGILAVTAILGRSLRWGLFCVIPCGLSVLANFAVMGWTAMPLGVATSMFAGMTLGIGVDYAIHLLERYRVACARGLEGGEALSDAVLVAGPAILIDGLAVGLGFGILTISRVPANARLGGIAMLSILGCLAATMLVLPALMRLFLFNGLKKPPSRRMPSC
jgi:predicted RND superfamily exporter protein